LNIIAFFAKTCQAVLKSFSFIFFCAQINPARAAMGQLSEPLWTFVGVWRLGQKKFAR
jgi:hypothetical protein